MLLVFDKIFDRINVETVALPVYDEYGEIERYNVFHASLIVRHSEDKKFYLYDILDIKKETSNPIEP